jgi:hypothetical protein
MKKTIALAILCAAAAMVLSCRQGTVPDEGKKMETEISPKVTGFLGNDIIDIIKSPEKVESYRVKFQKTGKGTTMGGYPVTAQGPDLAPKQIERLQAILLDANTYLFDVVKKCLFLPEYAYRFVRGGKNVIVLVCYSCEELTFVFEGRELLEDFNNATPRMRALTGELFSQGGKRP